MRIHKYIINTDVGKYHTYIHTYIQYAVMYIRTPVHKSGILYWMAHTCCGELHKLESSH